MSVSSPHPVPQRYASRVYTVPLVTRTRAPWRYRNKRKLVIKKSAADKKALAHAREGRKVSYHEALDTASSVILLEARKLHDQFGQHSVDYYLEELMQHSRLGKGKRTVNLWNVYLRQRLAAYNDSKSILYHHFQGRRLTYVDLQEGAPKKKSNELAAEIAASWKVMSKEEKEVATMEGKDELEEQRLLRLMVKRNVPVSAYNDACKTLVTIEKEVHLLFLYHTILAN